LEITPSLREEIRGMRYSQNLAVVVYPGAVSISIKHRHEDVLSSYSGPETGAREHTTEHQQRLME
jgi:hypothetical protein